MVAAQVIGNDSHRLRSPASPETSSSNVMLPVIAYNLLESIRLLANVSRALADRAIKGFHGQSAAHRGGAGALTRSW